MSEWRFCAELDLGTGATLQGFGTSKEEALETLAEMVSEQISEYATVYPVPDISVPFTAAVDLPEATT